MSQDLTVDPTLPTSESKEEIAAQIAEEERRRAAAQARRRERRQGLMSPILNPERMQLIYQKRTPLGDITDRVNKAKNAGMDWRNYHE